MSFINSRKRFKPHAHFLYDQFSGVEKESIMEIWNAFKSKKPDLANNTALNINSADEVHIREVLNLLNRPSDLSGGKTNDTVIWKIYVSEAEKIGLNRSAAEIVAGIGFHGIDEIKYL